MYSLSKKGAIVRTTYGRSVKIIELSTIQPCEKGHGRFIIDREFLAGIYYLR